jgi:hypothetical protein
MIRISFDFDGTLEHKHIQEYAKELIDRGIEVWIVTSRFGDAEKYKAYFSTTTGVEITNNDLFEVASNLGIPNERIHFTDMMDKWRFLQDKDFIWHLDDDWCENRQILKHTKTKAISAFGNSSWRQKCERILKKHESIQNVL